MESCESSSTMFISYALSPNPTEMYRACNDVVNKTDS